MHPHYSSRRPADRSWCGTRSLLASHFKICALAVCLALFAVGGAASAATAAIDVGTKHQIIRGFGGATAFMPTTPLTEADLDTLFGNGPGQIGFTMLRIRLASDAPWRALELSNARGAHARGAAIIATPWSPPVAMKTNNNLVAGSLRADAFGAYATYLNDFARYMADNGAPLYALSVQNEPDIAVTYESCDWTATQMLDFCRDYAGAITATKVIMPESFQFRHGMSDPVLNDPTATANIDIVGGHIYGAGLVPYPLAESKGKEVWMTEHLDLSTDWAGALATAVEIHDCLATANFNAYLWWYVRRYYGPLGEDSVVTKRGWVMAQFSKFIRPGAYRIEATASPTQNVFVSAYASDQLVIVAVNQSPADVTQTFSIAQGHVTRLSSWTTSSTLNLAPQAPIAVTRDTFSATLPAQSVTTFVGTLLFPPATIRTPPRSNTVAAGSTAVLEVAADGQFVTYQWHHDGVDIPGATDPLLTLRNISPSDAGSYTVTASNSGGSITAPPATLSVAPAGSASGLINLSTRSQVGAADTVQIAGFTIGGTTPRPVLVRAAGPALKTLFGINGTLDDPTIEVVVAGTGATVASNDDWDPALEAKFAAVGAFGWAKGSKDAAVLATLPPGSYTALVRGKNAGTGVALVEVYDAGESGQSGSPLVNLSTRSFVGTQDAVQIGGLVISGASARTVVLRASGPTLRKTFRLQGTLADPVFELRRQSDGAVLATAEDWAPFLADHFASVGAFPFTSESKDAAIVTTLDPGVYTLVVHGNADTTGVALLEVYAEP